MDKQKLNNHPDLKTFRRELRNQLTPAEAKLWDYLKVRKLEGRKFRRQHSIGPFILDFYCPAERVAIELDGQPHFSPQAAEYDRERDIFLAFYGVRVLRFENHYIFTRPEYVLNSIKACFGTVAK